MLHQPEKVLRSDAARSAYEVGFAEILRRRSEARFSDLDRAKLAEGLALFYADGTPENPRLPVEPFFAVQPNLRLQQIDDLFYAVEIGRPKDWILGYRPLCDLCEAEGFGVDSELRQIVERRNEAAHGNSLPTDILGMNELVSRIEFLAQLCAAIQQFIIAKICQLELGAGYKNGLLGNVTHVWTKASAFELTVTARPLSVGTAVVLIGHSACVGSSINSIQLDGNALHEFIGEEGTALGIKMDYIPSEGMHMIDAKNVRGLPALMGMQTAAEAEAEAEAEAVLRADKNLHGD
jgi:hypothetical protein